MQTTNPPPRHRDRMLSPHHRNQNASSKIYALPMYFARAWIGLDDRRGTVGQTDCSWQRSATRGAEERSVFRQRSPARLRRKVLYGFSICV